jgi:ATP-binding cassette subfamily B protein/subfamily B ATP-binding cassette protein MsbA
VWEGVSFDYLPGHAVLRGIDLRVPAGATVAVVGPTGAGKSTLLSLLPRFHDPAAGRVTIGGVDVREFTLQSLRGQIAMVLQPPLVFPGTVRENIAYGRSDADDAAIVDAARRAAAHDFVSRLPRGYETMVGDQGTTISEGEKQRLTIARALLRDAPILILDEPTASVDAETEALIIQGLRRLAAGRTTLVIAHRLSTVRQADLVVVLRDGRIVEQGTFEVLLQSRGAFSALYETQFTPVGRSGTGVVL